MSDLDAAPDDQPAAPIRPSRATDLLGVLGLALVSGGVGAVYWPAGVVAAGLSCLVLAWVAAKVEALR